MKHKISVAGLLIGWLLIFFLAPSEKHATYYIWLFIIFFLHLSIGVISLKYNYFLKAKLRLNSNLILLTFDDGPDPISTPKLLDTLKELNVKALFFIIGKKAEAHPELIQRILEEGHCIGNHTHTHPPIFAALTQKQVTREILECQQVIELQGQKTGRLFRPPIGYTNPRIARAVKKENFSVIGWSLRSYDSVFKAPNQLLKRLLNNWKPGDIILFHDNLPQTVSVMEEFICEARKNGAIFVDESQINAVFHEMCTT